MFIMWDLGGSNSAQNTRTGTVSILLGQASPITRTCFFGLVGHIKDAERHFMQNPPIESPKALFWTPFVTKHLFGPPVVFCICGIF